jgi:hypothetical protein
MPNTELLVRTLAHIEAHPDEWDQLHWARLAPCGTAYCFAGTALALAGKAEFQWGSRAVDSMEFAEQMADGEDIGTAAQRLLDLDMDDADALFDPNNTLDHLRQIVGQLTSDHTGAPA